MVSGLHGLQESSCVLCPLMGSAVALLTASISHVPHVPNVLTFTCPARSKLSVSIITASLSSAERDSPPGQSIIIAAVSSTLASVAIVAATQWQMRLQLLWAQWGSDERLY